MSIVNEMLKGKSPQGKHISMLKVGTKGQIVIPKEVRDMFNIKSGDSIILLADIERGIAINRADIMEKIIETAFVAGKE